MIKVENVETWGFEHAVRGMRNPMNSWDRSDSVFGWMYELPDDPEPCFKNIIGSNDLDLMRRLYKAGPEHRKFARQIYVSMDITAPLYFWKEFDTYKVGTVSNSCSTMHKIASKEFTLDDFSHEHLWEAEKQCLDAIIYYLNLDRKVFNKTKDKDYWWQMIQLLPSSYNQRRTVTMNYENVFSMIHQRSFHKLDEWKIFVDKLVELPYVKDIMGEDGPKFSNVKENKDEQSN